MKRPSLSARADTVQRRLRRTFHSNPTLPLRSPETTLRAAVVSQKGHTMSLEFKYPIIYVSDMARAREYYSTNLGFTCASGDDLFFEMTLNGRLVALNAAGIEPGKRPGSQTLLFTSDTIESIHATLRASGIKVEDLEETPYGRTFSVHDPDGNKIEIVESSPG